MNKKEVLEIRKQFTPDNCTIDHCCGCYVDADRQVILEHHDAFGTYSEEAAFKYFDIFRHTLSGSPGKHLLHLDFPLASEKMGGNQEFLLRLRDSHLEDPSLIQDFYQKIIESYICDSNYYIILIHAVYDVPGHGSDRLEIFDGSDSVYDFILCSICPVSLSKAGLCYNTASNAIEDRIRDWVVAMPTSGFLYPSFTDRSADIHSLLYYTKNPEKLQQDLIDRVFACPVPLSVKSQKETFQQLLAESLGDDCNFQLAVSLQENLKAITEETEDDGLPLELSKRDVRIILEDRGVPEEKIQNFENEYDDTISQETPILISSLTTSKNIEIKTPDLSIKVKPDLASLVETKIIDGRPCLVIPINDQVEVNGLPVFTIGEKESPLAE